MTVTWLPLWLLKLLFKLYLLPGAWIPPCSLDGKESAYNAGQPGSIPGWGRSPGEENSNPLQHSCLEKYMDREAWGATVQGIKKSQTQMMD